MSRPTPGTPLSQRRDYLYNQATRFIEIRNLAYLDYKNPDGTPLMTYEETLTDRDVVREKILNYELANGLIVNDGAAGQAAPTNFPAMNPEVQHMSFTPAPAPFAPPAAAPAPAPTFAPAPTPTFAPAPVAAAPSAPQATGPQPELQAPPTSGRGRRKAPGAGGAAVAPPPAAPPAGPAPTVEAQPTFAPPPAPGFAAPAPTFAAPPAPTFSAPVAPVPVAPASVDFTPVFQRVDALGAGFESLSKQLEEVKATNAALTKQNEALLGAIFALAQTNQATSAWMAQSNGGNAMDFSTFKKFSAYLAGIPQ